MRTLLYALVFVIGAGSSAVALKWSDQQKAKTAIEAIQMADALAAGTPEAIDCRIRLDDTGVSSPVGSPNRPKVPRVVLQAGQPAFDTLLAHMTTKLNNDKAAAEAYLAAQGVTND